MSGAMMRNLGDVQDAGWAGAGSKVSTVGKEARSFAGLSNWLDKSHLGMEVCSVMSLFVTHNLGRT